MSLSIIGGNVDLENANRANTSLKLSHCTFTIDEIAKLDKLIHIEISYTVCDVNIGDFAIFANLKNLVIERISTNTILDINSLNQLNLEYFKLVARPEDKLVAIDTLKLDNMHSLHLCNIGKNGSLLKRITANSLKSLTLINCSIGNLIGISKFPELAALKISGCEILSINGEINMLENLLLFELLYVGIMPSQLKCLSTNILRVMYCPGLNNEIIDIIKKRKSSVKSARKK